MITLQPFPWDNEPEIKQLMPLDSYLCSGFLGSYGMKRFRYHGAEVTGSRLIFCFSSVLRSLVTSKNFNIQICFEFSEPKSKYCSTEWQQNCIFCMDRRESATRKGGSKQQIKNLVPPHCSPYNSRNIRAEFQGFLASTHQGSWLTAGRGGRTGGCDWIQQPPFVSRVFEIASRRRCQQSRVNRRRRPTSNSPI